MAVRPSYPRFRGRLRDVLPSAAEFRVYRRLSRDVILVIAGFIAMGLLIALAAGLLPH